MFLGSNLQYLRKRTGNMTQEKLAEKLDVSRQTVSKWESGEAYPEIPKLMELCEIFRCTLDDLLRKDMAQRASIYLPVRIVRVEPMRLAQYVIISPDPEADVRTYLDNWARKSGLASMPGYTPKQIGWDFPYVSGEQKNRFHLRGYAAAWILPEDFQAPCTGPRILTQESACYAVMTVRDPFAAPFDRIPHAYQLILEYLSANGCKKKVQKDVLPCFEYVYEKDGTVYMDVFIHCEATEKTNIYSFSK